VEWLKGYIAVIYVCGFSICVTAQNAEPSPKFRKPEIFNSGFLDIANNGQVNASARMLRLYIGEPQKFAIPLSVYAGVSAQQFQPGSGSITFRSNEHLSGALINPLAGLLNFSFDNVLFSEEGKMDITAAGIIYHAGFRVLTGYFFSEPNDPRFGKPVNFVNLVGAGGFLLRTGAWEKSDKDNMGVFWISARYIGSHSPRDILGQFYPGIVYSFYHGWSVGGGIEINNLLNLKLVFYRYVQAPLFADSNSFCQFSFHYALTK
jgi:hypothetical protein